MPILLNVFVEGSPPFEILEAELQTVYWSETWVPVVVVFAVAELTYFSSSVPSAYLAKRPLLP